MKKELKSLVKELEENNQSWELYPTSEEMIKPIIDDIKKEYSYRTSSYLDIGCGTCNFKKFFDKFSDDEISMNKIYMSKYYVFEKSKILIDRLDKDTVVLGTDFNNNLLYDKQVDIIFCNPPYSEYVEWTKRIISESNCKCIYMVIPSRWKDNQEIVDMLDRYSTTEDHIKGKFRGQIETNKILGSFDFLNAERSARAKVDVLKIVKQRSSKNSYFDEWFDKTFEMKDKDDSSSYDREKEKSEELRNELVPGINKTEVLVNLYQKDLNLLQDNFKAICSLDVDILSEIGISKNAVKDSLKSKIKSLKSVYWKMVFENLEQITDRLTSESREAMFSKFNCEDRIDFDFDNIYAVVMWIIKNSNAYFDEQLIDLYKYLSSNKNVKPYKSNKKTFETDTWRFNFEENTHYTLDYRIVCHAYACFSYSLGIDKYGFEKYISDFHTIANNLGFTVGSCEFPTQTGEIGKTLLTNGKVLFEYRIYKNKNMHIKCNIEFMKALNVEASRLLGWVHGASDIKNEFPDDMKKGAEKYFKANANIQSLSGLKLLN